jgi:hypothetical protein
VFLQPMMESFISAKGLGQSPVKVYRLKSTINIDIRYTLRHKPFIGVSGATQNSPIHVQALESAGFTNLTHYRVLELQELKGVSSNLCVTLMTEPHFSGLDPSGAPTDEFVQAMHNFVDSGGNFLAQCQGIITYENCATTNSSGQAPHCAPGFFLTTGGLNAPVYNLARTKEFFYHNADLAIMQLDDWTYVTGSVGLFDLFHSSSLTTQLKPNGYFAIQYGTTNGTTSNTSYALAGIKTNLAVPGSNVFYLGGHILTDTPNIRPYFNAILTGTSSPNFAFVKGEPALVGTRWGSMWMRCFVRYTGSLQWCC